MSFRTERIFAGLLVVAGAVLGSCSNPDLGDVPFRCSAPGDAGNACPGGYRCASGLCVRNDRVVPILLSSNLDPGDAAFSIAVREHDAVVCWNRAPQTGTASIDFGVVRPDTTLDGAVRTLYHPDDTAAVVNGVAGSCGTIGGKTILAVSQWTTNLRVAIRQYSVDTATPSLTPVMGMIPDQPNDAVARTVMSTVGNELWLPFTVFLQETVALHGVYLVRTTADLMTAGARLPFVNIGVTEQIRATEALGGDNGGWIRVVLGSGESLIRWTDSNVSSMTTLRFGSPPVPPGAYDEATALAVRGNTLGMAYRLEPSSWRLYWVVPDGTTMDPMRYDPTTVTPGPTLTVAAGVSQLGAYRVGDDLFVAGATDSSHIALWHVPFGGTTAELVTTFEKLTNIVPTRLRASALEGNAGTLVVWSEDVPQSAGTRFTSLFAAVLHP